MRTSLLSLFLLVGCASSRPAPVVSFTSAADGLRAERARAANDFERALITEELAAVELERARTAHSVFAYRRFLEEFPIGREATTARTLLEALRFDEARNQDTPLAWQSFLAEHAEGAHAAEARERLGSLAVDEVTRTGDLAGVRDVLSRYPDHPRREALVALEDRLAFEQARGGGLTQVSEYLSAHPMGAHRVEALDLRERLEHDTLLASGDLEKARRRASADPSGRSQGLVDEMLLAEALASFDVGALETISEEAVTPVRVEAAQLLESLKASPLPAEVRSAMEKARPSHGLRSLAQIAAVLRSGDPLDREFALKEAAEYASWQAAALVLDAVENRYIGVRLAAVESLRRLKTAMPEAAWRAFADGRETEALMDALTAAPWRRVAALRDADGRESLALAAWREALRYDPDDLAASARVLDLSQSTGDRLGVGAAARQLAATASLFGDGRWLQPHDAATPAVERRDGPGTIIGAPAAVTVLRQLCSALELTRKARASLAALRAGSQATEMQLYALAINDADTAVARMVARRAEQERDVSRRGYAACGTDPLGEKLAKIHGERVEAIGAIAQHGDRRLLPFVTRLANSPSHAVRDAATSAARVLTEK